MITVGEMIRNLQYYPMDAKCYAYQGEIDCVVIIDKNGYERGFIIAQE